MKVFQKIKSPKAGRIKTILVENEQPVKDGDTIIILELE
ncbi:MAG: biotin/lipoyl-binding protein [Desulfobacterales bacterium]